MWQKPITLCFALFWFGLRCGRANLISRDFVFAVLEKNTIHFSLPHLTLAGTRHLITLTGTFYCFFFFFLVTIHGFGPKTAVKAVTAAQLSMALTGVYSVTLDEAIEAMRLTAADMSVKYKETSLSVSHNHTF
jgi:hypothetical protein